MTTSLYPTSPAENRTVPASDADVAAACAEIRARHERFKTAVRDEIIEQRRSGKWCRDGCNRSLTELDLPELSIVYSGQVTITADVTVRNTDSRHVAETCIRNALHLDSTDGDVVIDDVTIDDPDALYEHDDN